MAKMGKSECLDVDIEFLSIASFSLESFDVVLIDVVRGEDYGFPSHGCYDYIQLIYNIIAPYQSQPLFLLYYPCN